jgi:hypothetical protein
VTLGRGDLKVGAFKGAQDRFMERGSQYSVSPRGPPNVPALPALRASLARVTLAGHRDERAIVARCLRNRVVWCNASASALTGAGETRLGLSFQTVHSSVRVQRRFPLHHDTYGQLPAYTHRIIVLSDSEFHHSDHFTRYTQRRGKRS